MKHQLTEKTKLLQKAWLVSDDKLLLLKRAPKSKTRANQWDLPGGNSEWPDYISDIKNPHQADLIREIQEETALDVTQYWQERQQPIYFATYFQSQKQLFTVIVIWLIKLPHGFGNEVKISHEHTQFVWVKFNQLSTYDFGFAGEPGGFIAESIKKIIQ